MLTRLSNLLPHRIFSIRKIIASTLTMMSKMIKIKFMDKFLIFPSIFIIINPSKKIEITFRMAVLLKRKTWGTLKIIRREHIINKVLFWRIRIPKIPIPINSKHSLHPIHQIITFCLLIPTSKQQWKMAMNNLNQYKQTK